MDTTASVEIGCLARLGEAGPVSVPCNQHLAIGFTPIEQTLFNFATFFEVFGWAGGIFDTQQLQVAPKMTDKEAASLPALIVERVSLMAMGQHDPATAAAMAQGDTFDHVNPFEEGQDLAGTFIIIIIQGPPNDSRIFSLHIMIAKNYMQPVLVVELLHDPEDMAVRVADICEVPIFPKFIPSPNSIYVKPSR